MNTQHMPLDPLLDQLTQVLIHADDLERLTRELLKLLGPVMGLESIYLTSIDFERKLQKVLFAINVDGLTIPESLTVPWEETLCMLALADGQLYVRDVAATWPQSEPARQLAISTFLTEPIRLGEGQVFGTLCGISRASIELPPELRRLFSMAACLIARQIEHEELISVRRQDGASGSRHSVTDPLTGIANRRALTHELTKMLANAECTGATVYVAVLDLDGFKSVNDEYGYDLGDQFLIHIARSLAGGVRQGDLVARYGGDEFVLAGMASAEDAASSRNVLRQRLQTVLSGHFDLQDGDSNRLGASIGIVTSALGDRNAEQLLAKADQVLDAAKHSGQGGRPRPVAYQSTVP